MKQEREAAETSVFTLWNKLSRHLAWRKWEKKILSAVSAPLRLLSLTLFLLRPAARGALQLGVVPQHVGGRHTKEWPRRSGNTHCGMIMDESFIFVALAKPFEWRPDSWQSHCCSPRQVKKPTRRSTTSSTTWVASDMPVRPLNMIAQPSFKFQASLTTSAIRRHAHPQLYYNK